VLEICLSGVDARSDLEGLVLGLESASGREAVQFDSDACVERAVPAGRVQVSPPSGTSVEPALGQRLAIEAGERVTLAFSVPPGCEVRVAPPDPEPACALWVHEARPFRGGTWAAAGRRKVAGPEDLVVGCDSKLSVSAAEDGWEVWPPSEAQARSALPTVLRPSCREVGDVVVTVRDADGAPLRGATRLAPGEGARTEAVPRSGLRLHDWPLRNFIGTLSAPGFLDRRGWAKSADSLRLDPTGTAWVEFRLTSGEGRSVRPPITPEESVAAVFCVGEVEGWLNCRPSDEAWICMCPPSNPIFATVEPGPPTRAMRLPIRLPHRGADPVDWVEVCEDPGSGDWEGTWAVWVGPAGVPDRYREALGLGATRIGGEDAPPLCVLAPEGSGVEFRADADFTRGGEILAEEGAVWRWSDGGQD
jgi:hypothetical protein